MRVCVTVHAQQVKWDDGDKQVGRLNPWETQGIPGVRQTRQRG